MRASILVLIVSVLIGTSVNAQHEDEHQADVLKLINALASENPAPTERRGPDLKFPPGYDRKKQEPVRSAKSKLKAFGPAAFKSLIENWGDERYCLTYSVGINGYMYNATVGKMCRIIVYDQIQPYGIWPRTEDDPRGKPKRPSYPSVFLSDQKAATKWLEEHKDKSLFEIQLMVIDWVIARESESLKDFTDEERAAMREIREKLVESKKPMTRGNYYMDYYD
jgi:hypothetical protein